MAKGRNEQSPKKKEKTSDDIRQELAVVGQPSNEEIRQERILAVKRARAALVEAQAKLVETNPPSKSVFMGNLHLKISDKKIKSFFKDCGVKMDIHRVLERESKTFKGSVIINFSTLKNSARAVLKNGQVFSGRTVECSYAKPKIESVKRKKYKLIPDGCDTIYLANFSDDVDEVKIRHLFKDCGVINKVGIISKQYRRGQKSQKTKNAAFITFADPDKSLSIAKSYDNTDFLGSKIRIDYQKKKGRMAVKPDGCNTIFVGNLPGKKDVEDDKIKELFKDCGAIENFSWLGPKKNGKFQQGRSLFVRFADPGLALPIAIELNGHVFDGNKLTVGYAKHTRPTPSKAQKRKFDGNLKRKWGRTY